VRIADRNPLRRAGLLAAVAFLAVAPVGTASAQGFFESLFGGGFQRREPLPPQTSSYSDPFHSPGSESRRGGEGSVSYGHGTAFCVRTCDGRYFPIQRLGGMSPADACRSFCPASRTMVFTGSRIDSAVAANGTRYADLDNAFLYRNQLVNNCTCNGRTGGLARLDTMSDPTLRPGDIVATTGGLATFRGKNKTAEFTPINPSSGAWAQRLSEMKVEPAPPQAPVAAAADNEQPPQRKGRAQASR